MAISAIVPARNEQANIADAVESLASQPEITEIFVIDDQSTDRTAAILQELAARYVHVKILQTETLPSGWVGKNYAVSLGARQAAAEWLLFTDADCVHLPGSAAHALADAAAFNAQLVSYSPEQVTRTWWERSLIPFIYTRLSQRFTYQQVNDPQSPAAAANGQYLLILREDYARIGGHAAVASEVLEDLALARLAKQQGVRLHFASGQGIVRARMYRTFGGMWEGWSKNLYPLVCGAAPNAAPDMVVERDADIGPPPSKPRSVLRELGEVVPWVPVLLLLLSPLHLILGGLGIVLLAGRHASYAGMLQRNRFPRSYALYYLPGVLLYSAVLLYSEWRHARGRVAWKGREYPVGRDV
jgi:hypothetical protein